MARSSPKTSRHTEIERKFEVTESSVSPSFDGFSLVTRVEAAPAELLDAVYFDTPGRDLATHKITLRRRTGGSDAGWHLKLPAGPDARTEVRAPLESPETVPDALRDTVLAIVREQVLAPVARITTRRTIKVLHGSDGAALAEFCDDQVTASTIGGDEQHWREWELELLTEQDASGLLDRLSTRLVDAGARPAGHGSKLARVLDAAGQAAPVGSAPTDPVHRAIAEQVDQLLVWDRAVRVDTYDSVHQMRVTTRKIRSLLQESKDLLPGADTDWILNELRTLAAVLGVARDAEVLAERYRHALDGLPEQLVRGPVRERLVDGADRRYESGLRRALAAMGSQRYFQLLDALEQLVRTETTSPPGKQRAGLNIDSAYQRVRKAAKSAAKAAADEHTDHDEALHRIRKGAKRLLYTAAATGAD
jgi:CHAD domain-containing protein